MEEVRKSLSLSEKILVLNLILMFGNSPKGSKYHAPLNTVLRTVYGLAETNPLGGAVNHHVWRSLATQEGFVTNGIKDDELRERFLYTVGYHLPNIEREEYIKTHRNCFPMDTKGCCITMGFSTSLGSFAGGIVECVSISSPLLSTTGHLIMWGTLMGVCTGPCLIGMVVNKAGEIVEKWKLEHSSDLKKTQTTIKRTQDLFKGRFFEPLRRASDSEELPEIMTMNEEPNERTSLKSSINNYNKS